MGVLKARAAFKIALDKQWFNPITLPKTILRVNDLPSLVLNDKGRGELNAGRIEIPDGKHRVAVCKQFIENKNKLLGTLKAKRALSEEDKVTKEDCDRMIKEVSVWPVQILDHSNFCLTKLLKI